MLTAKVSWKQIAFDELYFVSILLDWICDYEKMEYELFSWYWNEIFTFNINSQNDRANVVLQVICTPETVLISIFMGLESSNLELKIYQSN